jgi:hypothetical protein
MSNQFHRDQNNQNALINKGGSYTSRIAVKNNHKKQKSEIADLKTQLLELKEIVDGLTGV